MTERSIVEAAARLRRQGEPHLVATVVCVHGAAYRKPGARMLLTRFRWIAGTASGGGLEGDLSHDAWLGTREGAPVLVRFDARTPADADVRAAFGLGCDGIVEVMVERAGTPGRSDRIDPLALAHECLRAQRRAAVATVFRSDAPGVAVGARIALRSGGELFGDALPDAARAQLANDVRAAIEDGASATRSYRAEGGGFDAFVEALLPPPRLFVLGTGHDAVPVVEAARALGWDVAVCTHEPRVAIRERFSRADEVVIASPTELALRVDECDRAVAIVMGHDYELDRAHVGMLVASRARYIGVLGPRARTTRMLADLGLGERGDARIHAPLGLPLGAETPQELALAAIAEIQAALARAPDVRLRDVA
ncbi:MAG TPA: XdhC family protein [Kofleriaceae bacterium]|nr:XdhC family protein [Kofleriaceae bacterium]